MDNDADHATHTFRDQVARKFESIVTPPGTPPTTWVPDVHTLLWLLHGADAAAIGTAMKTDVQARQQSSSDWSPDSMWYFAADAAIEALLFPALIRAQELGDLRQ